MSKIMARPRPLKPLERPTVHAAPRLGLASIQAVPFEGNGTTDAAWAVVYESPEGDYSTLGTGLTKGAKRTAPAKVGDEYGQDSVRLALFDAFLKIHELREGLGIETLMVHCPDVKLAQELTATLKDQSRITIGAKGSFTSEFRHGNAWKAWPMAYDAAAARALEETKKNPIDAASDGSIHPFMKGAGAGWLLADGRCGVNLVDTTEILGAELSGIKSVIAAVDKHQAVRIHVDSIEAINVTNSIFEDGNTVATKNKGGIVHNIGEDIEKLAKGKTIELVWVKGHDDEAGAAGNKNSKFNDAADSLAKAASRHNRGDIDQKQLGHVVLRVREELVNI